MLGLKRSDEDLVSDCLAGDREAFGTLVLRYQKRVIGVAYRALRDNGLAEDLAQEVFMRAYRSLKGFKAGKRFGPWIMAICANRTRDYLKLRGKRAEVIWDLDRSLRAPRSTPLERAAARETLTRIEKAISELPEETQEVLRLRFIMGLDYQEVAETLGLALGTVKSRISRAREALRLLIQEVL